MADTTMWLDRLLAFAVVAGLMFGGLTACGQSESAQAAMPITLVITGTSAEPRPALSDDLRAKLAQRAHHAKKPGEAIVRIISSSTGPIIERDLVPMRSNGQVEHASAAADRKITSAIDDLAEIAADAKADTPGLSVLPLFDRASQIPNSDIHLLSSVITTENPTDLRVLGWEFQPTNVVDAIEQQGQLPNLAGHSITFEGIGMVAGSQPRLAPFARTVLTNLWVLVCERMQAASCTTTAGPVSTQLPISTLSVPVVPVPDTYTVSGCPVWTKLSDSALHFAPDSAVFGPEADAVLLPIVQAAQRCNLAVDIAGHIADVGTSGGDSSNLSGRRAQAVADRLRALGLPPNALGSVIGRGASEPVIPNFTGGQFDESKAVANRRTELSFHRMTSR